MARALDMNPSVVMVLRFKERRLVVNYFPVAAFVGADAVVVILFKYLLVLHVFEDAHLLDSDAVEAVEAIALGHAFVDEDSVEVFHVAEANQLIDSGIVSDVALLPRVGFAPFFGGDAK